MTHWIALTVIRSQPSPSDDGALTITVVYS